MTKWTVTEVSQATGLSEGTISGYFNGRNITTKKGLTLAQVLEVIHAPKRDHGTNNSEKTRALVKILQVAGEYTPYTYQED